MSVVQAAPYNVSQITLGLALTDMEIVSNETLIIQIGTFSTRPDLRSTDHARSAIALHLIKVDAQGVPDATPCISGPNEISAYQAVRFKQIRDLVLSIFETSQVIL